MMKFIVNWEVAGVFLFIDINKGDNYSNPINTAIQYGYIENGSLSSLPLVIPIDNTWNGGMPWAGKDEFYVLLVPIYGQTFYAVDGKIYTEGGNDPVKVSITGALTTLDFSKFKDVGDVLEH
jgi:hypothetical protein